MRIEEMEPSGSWDIFPMPLIWLGTDSQEMDIPPHGHAYVVLTCSRWEYNDVFSDRVGWESPTTVVTVVAWADGSKEDRRKFRLEGSPVEFRLERSPVEMFPTITELVD